jgi:hypothetical protein
MTTVLPENSMARLVVRVLLQIGEETYPLGDAELGSAFPAIRDLLAPTGFIPPEAILPVPSSLLSSLLRERLASLCARLGEKEPDYSTLTEQEATSLLARLQAEEEDLLQTATQARTQPSPPPATSPVDRALVHQLKQRWRTRYQPQGSVEDLQRAWGHFKQRICGEAVGDRAIGASQYEQLLAALTATTPERTSRP